MKRILTSVLFALVVVGGLAACDPYTPAPCTTDCIEMVYVNENADQLSVVGKGGATIPQVTIYSDAARTQVAGYARAWAPHMYQTMPITAQYQGLPAENPVKAQLKPGLTYYYLAKASGQGGKVYTETGSFKTKQRVVAFTVNKIWLYDDSDLTGTGEITMEARINGGSFRRVYQNLDWTSQAPAVNPKFTGKVSGTMNTVTFQVRGWDDDCEFSSCTPPASAWGAYGGNGDTQWSTATFVLQAPTSGQDGTWKASAPGNGVGTVGFNVEGTWSVRYESV